MRISKLLSLSYLGTSTATCMLLLGCEASSASDPGGVVDRTPPIPDTDAGADTGTDPGTDAGDAGTDADVPSAPSKKGIIGGGGDFAGGGGEWGGGGSLFAGGGGFWSGGGGHWSGGGGWWNGGGGQWSGGSDLVAGGGGWWNGGGGHWNGGGGHWTGGGNWWTAGGGYWAGGGGLWGGGFATAFPFVGWSGARFWQFRGVPKNMIGSVQYQAADSTTWPAFSSMQDTSACPNGLVRLGGFATNFDADGWPGFLALGYTKALCIPTPGGGGLRVQPTAGDGSFMGIGGYTLQGQLDSAPGGQVDKDRFLVTSLVGEGVGNVATQYGGALCATIGSLAGAKRSCAVGVAFSDLNLSRDGVTPTVRGTTVLASAQSGVALESTPFGRPDGHGIYGQSPGDMESYVNRVMQEHSSIALPTSATAIDSWNEANLYSRLPLSGADFAPRTVASTSNANTLLANINRSLTSPLNMVPIDPIVTGTTDPLQDERLLDMSHSVTSQSGKMYALNLQTLALQQNPLYGSGGGRWFFHDPSDPAAGAVPLVDLSSVYQGQLRFVTGQLVTGGPNAGTLVNPYITDTNIVYADWHPNPAGTYGIHHAGQYPTTIMNDADRQARLRSALSLPMGQQNVAVGFTHVCSLGIGGGVKCWGDNFLGEIGNGLTGEHSVTPSQVVGLTSGVTAISAGFAFSCALTVGGAVQCWGYNGQGQLGMDPGWSSSAVPNQIPGLTSGVTAISVGKAHACALTSTGGVKCWGDNSQGQLGDGTTTNAITPVQVTGLSSGVTAISAGNQFTCALLATGGVQCWGYNSDGELGNASATNSSTPVQASGLTSGVTSIATGGYHTCALLLDGSAKCWGYNKFGQLGNGSTIIAFTPTPVTGLSTGVSALSLGMEHSCALMADGSIKCWGRNDNYGQLGNGTMTNSSTPVATLFASATSVAAGSSGWATCARTTAGDVQCAGSNQNGEVGIPRYTTTTQTTFANATQLSVGLAHTCQVTAAGAVQCLGNGAAGELGNGTNNNSYSFVQATGLTSGVAAVTTGLSHTCALLTTGGLKCWGYNAVGGVGDGTRNSPNSPVQVSGLTSGVTAVATGDLNTCAIVSGSVQCWGWGAWATVGNGSTSDALTPAQVTGLTSGATSIAMGIVHACAVVSGGVKCWGANGNGNLGDGSAVAMSTTPVQVSGLTSGVTEVVAGGNHSCALLADGTVRCWGYNANGELGNGSTTNSGTPVVVSGVTGATSLVAGRTHTCALLGTGAVKCWGDNSYGELGDGTTTSSSTAVQVSGLIGATSLVSGSGHATCAVTAGGNQCWGDNFFGGLGLPVTDAVPTPTSAAGNFFNGGLIPSQGSVLIQKFAAAAGSTISGHVTPIAFTMANATTGNQALMVTYDPLAAAAALFIDQYQAHINACNQTFDESGTELAQQAGTYLWACSNATDKAAYLSGMQTLLAGARSYLFGRPDGSATAPCTGTTFPSYCIDPKLARMPYMFIVPDYKTSAYNGDPAVTSGPGAYYYDDLDQSLQSYRAALFASSASGLHKSLQLAGIMKFGTDTSAIVTTRVKRSGVYGASCTQ